MSNTIYKHADFEVPDWGEFASGPENRPGYRSLLLSYGPLAYWRLGEASGSTAFDSSGHGHDAVYVGGVQLGQPGALDHDADSSVMLDGNTGQITFPNTVQLTLNDPVTIAYWSRIQTSEVRRSVAFSLGGNDSPDRCQAHAPWHDGILYWDYGTFDSAGRLATDYADYLNRWTFVVLVSAGRLGSFKAIYLDGELAASSSTSSGPAQTISGGSLSVDPTVSNWQHRGKLDEFSVFNQLLSAEQISALYRAGVNVWA